MGNEFIQLTEFERMDDDESSFIIGLVEDLFGPRHEQTSILGVFFANRRTPFTTYPPPYDQFRVAICIPEHQSDDPFARLVHVAHEAVHCLTPNGPPPRATVLEEGLAEHAKIYLAHALYLDEYPDYDFRDLTGGAYGEAFDLVEHVVEFEGLEEMRAGIRKIRAETCLPIADFELKRLTDAFPNTPKHILGSLSQRFKT